MNEPALDTASRDRLRAQIRIGVYFGGLFLAGNFASPIGIPQLPIQFYLKDRLRLPADQVAIFLAITGIPLVLGFLFGFLRDRWRPLGGSDRGWMLLASPFVVMAYLWLAFGKGDYERLLIGYLLSIFFYRFVSTSMSALSTVVARRFQMTGRLSALWNVIAVLPMIVSNMMGGWLVDRVSLRGVWLIVAAFAGLTFVAAFREAPEVHAVDETDPPTRESGLHAIRRLIRHRPLWPAALIWMMWNFSPGFYTPALFYLTNSVHLSGTQFGIWRAVFLIALGPTIALYGILCRRFSLRRLLWVGAVLAVPQMIPLLYTHTVGSAMVAAVAMGLIGGLPQAAYWDLVMRSCPEGLEGTGVMLADAGFYIAYSAGDLIGTALYARGGFLPNVIAMTATYALILAVLPFVPRHVTNRSEDEPNAPSAA